MRVLYVKRNVRTGYPSREDIKKMGEAQRRENRVNRKKVWGTDRGMEEELAKYNIEEE